MSLIKRSFTTLFSRIDNIVGEIENHDALIKATITEQRKKIAVAKVQLARVRSNEQQLKGQIAELALNERRWSQRAVKESATNEEKALTCLHRRQQIREKTKKLETMEKQYQQAADKMQSDINRCEDKLKAMSQKLELMRARQSSAEAINVINNVDGTSLEDIEDSFDRWEVKITQGELATEYNDSSLYDLGSDTDALEADYLSQENEDALRDELSTLLEKRDSTREGDSHE